MEVMGQPFWRRVRIIDSNSFQPGSRRNGLYIQLDYSTPGQQIQGHSSLSLSSSLRDPSMVREVLGLEIARKYMPAPKANYANVWINNERYGLYVNVESVEGISCCVISKGPPAICITATRKRLRSRFPDALQISLVPCSRTGRLTASSATST
ncbi:MAG: CotH kinase family protein [Saprospirales bacterium]|nr:CotH kinase family protein [Saprospirales bacterium]